MAELDWTAAESPAEILQALDVHRLLPVAGLLAERGLLRADLVHVAERMAKRALEQAAWRGALETETCAALSEAGVETLVLKGALLARTVYPDPPRRLRTDLDVLVRAADFRAAGRELRALGFRRTHAEHSGLPITQETFVRRDSSLVEAVDLHWEITHRSPLKGRLPFEPLWARSEAVDGLPDGVRGLSHADALLHACGHYFGHFRGQFRPDAWLLDMDLLWRSMGEPAREEAAGLAREVGLASLLAAGLSRAADRFATQVDRDWLHGLAVAGSGERTARLLAHPKFGLGETIRNALDEPKRSEGLQLLYRTFVPKAAYMRIKYSGAPAWQLPWLYLRRVVDGIRGRGR